MTVSAKDLRFKISMLFDILRKGEEITITYRGKPEARLISFDKPENNSRDDALFGMWKEKEGDVDRMVREMRQGRDFAL